MRKVYFEKLPKRDGLGSSKGRQVVDWINSIGHNVSFVYDDIKGKIEIISYNKRNEELQLKYNNKIMNMNIANFKKANLGNLIGSYTRDFKLSIGETVIDTHRDIVIIDREYRKYVRNNKNVESKKYYKYKCNKCGWTEGWLEETQLTRGFGCACCKGVFVIEGINDIPTTVPWMIKYFQGGYNEAKLYTRCSNKEIYPICPDCGCVRNKAIKINLIHKLKSVSCTCSDNFSYPEKFLFNVLQQVGVNFEVQLSKTIFEWCGSYRYDFYLPEYNCIIETHGMQHYKDIKSWTSDVEQVMHNDMLKRELALSNGIDEYIIVDCRFSDLEYIKNNILNSELVNMFDLSKVDWLKCEEFALKNIAKGICDYWNKNHSIDLTKQHFKLSRPTIISYLKKGTRLNWCDYISENKKNKKGRSGKKVQLIKDNKIIKIYNSVSELCRELSMSTSKVCEVCNGKRKSHKDFTFKYI